MASDSDGNVIIDGEIETFDLTNANDTFTDETTPDPSTSSSERMINSLNLTNAADTLVVEMDPPLTIIGLDGDDTYNLDLSGTIIVDDSGGTNTLNFGNSAEGTNVSLETGIVSVPDGVVLLVGVGIFNKVIGSTGDDVIVGTSGDDVLDGHGGSDILNGGDGEDLYIIRLGGETTLIDSDGVDTIDFSNLPVGINVNLSRSGGQIQSIDELGSDLVLNGMFENVIGTPFDDTIGGNSADNLLDGGAGNDHIVGSDGNDILLGRAGDDDLVGRPGRDFLVGGFGSDRVVGSSEEDIVIGGALNFGNQEAITIDDVFAEWTSERTYAKRVANITGTGSGIR